MVNIYNFSSSVERITHLIASSIVLFWTSAELETFTDRGLWVCERTSKLSWKTVDWCSWTKWSRGRWKNSDIHQYSMWAFCCILRTLKIKMWCISAKDVEESLKLSSEIFFNKFGRVKPDAGTEMIFHCKGGMRSGRATEVALSLGFAKWDEMCKLWKLFLTDPVFLVLKATRDRFLIGINERIWASENCWLLWWTIHRLLTEWSFSLSCE